MARRKKVKVEDADLDGDGEISLEELEVALEKLNVVEPTSPDGRTAGEMVASIRPDGETDEEAEARAVVEHVRSERLTKLSKLAASSEFAWEQLGIAVTDGNSEVAHKRLKELLGITENFAFIEGLLDE